LPGYACTDAGEVYTFGANESGQLGCRGRSTQSDPVLLDSLQSHVVGIQPQAVEGVSVCCMLHTDTTQHVLCTLWCFSYALNAHFSAQRSAASQTPPATLHLRRSDGRAAYACRWYMRRVGRSTRWRSHRRAVWWRGGRQSSASSGWVKIRLWTLRTLGLSRSKTNP